MDDAWLALFFIFLVFVAPIWLILHYRFKSKLLGQGDSKENQRRLQQLQQLAERLENRVENLERILDEKVPDWRRYR
ncbi:envelope stress response membrane protein PspB [Thioflexithrix psekupsensis]|uniref:Phage shock protein B n=1 Tax=Thioflexithrix psekupsensis TaxID=1570016 RepID=A0A251X388_9GAMM|nr:envelope stress response membrane protein PspB [Thioflexithrix psekupsensis]OUD11745.1 phage shock protein B [Thioflexithrix psekupsensis]